MGQPGTQMERTTKNLYLFNLYYWREIAGIIRVTDFICQGKISYGS